LVVLTDGEGTVATALDATHSPTNYILGRDGHILVEGQLEDDGLTWEALAILDANRRPA
jgi:hypothetical protein